MNAVSTAQTRRGRDDLGPLVRVEGGWREAAPPETVRIEARGSRARALAVRPRLIGMLFADPAFRAMTHRRGQQYCTRMKFVGIAGIGDKGRESEIC